MKRLLYIFLILPIVVVNCNKDAEIEPLSDAKISASINGNTTSFRFKSADFYYGDFRIIAELDDFVLTMFMVDFETGTYEFGIDQFNEAILFENEDESVYFSSNCALPNTGQITISSIDSILKTFSGSFDFEACNNVHSTNERKITNGVFSDLKFSGSNLGGQERGKLKMKKDNQMIAFRNVICSGNEAVFSSNAFLTNGTSFQLAFKKPGFDGSFQISDLDDFNSSFNNNEGNCLYMATQGNLDITSTENGLEISFNLQLANQCNSEVINLTDGFLYDCE